LWEVIGQSFLLAGLSCPKRRGAVDGNMVHCILKHGDGEGLKYTSYRFMGRKYNVIY
jgi:hypothetical protein